MEKDRELGKQLPIVANSREIITTRLFEAYLKCPTKCFLQSIGEAGQGNAYADWVRAQNESYRNDGVNRLSREYPNGECIAVPLDTENLKTAEWRLAINFAARIENLESAPHAVERIPSNEPRETAQFIPIRFTFNNKLTRDDKLLLAFDALVLSGKLNREPRPGKAIHGDDYSTLRVKTSALVSKVRKITGNMTTLLARNSPPDLILNRHCGECEFRDRCRQKAIEKDDLSLLSSMAEKERKKFNSKGIFTITQLSFTFRPRRRTKRLREKKEKYHHSLKALAIREKKIHIIGSPKLKIEGTPVYLDVEALPDRDFYYLIGVRIKNGDSIAHHSLWANSLEDERGIWSDFLCIISAIENPVLIHYGSFETKFFKRMCGRYGEPQEETIAAKALKSSINILSVIYAQIYFPGLSNGLKDTATFLGFNWADADSSGLQSIAWRHSWEASHDSSIKGKLIDYNTQDCEALNLVTTTIQQFDMTTTDQNGRASIFRVDFDKFLEKSKWHTFTSSIANLEHINSAAHWDYQRDRVFARSHRPSPKIKKRTPHQEFSKRVEQTVVWERLRSCPACHRSYRIKGPVRSKALQDIIFGRHSLKRRLVKYVFQIYRCRGCGADFGMPDRFKFNLRYGWSLIAYLFYQVIALRIPQRMVVRSFNRLFDFDLNRSTLGNMKTKVADYYSDTKQKILERIINGGLIHADETRANIKGKSAFVWVLTSFHEVVYILSETREGELAQKLLANFKGVLVSDFYTAYDSINCPQQKCLIHLMRDLNDEILNSPFDEQLKRVVADFGGLLRPIVETVDRYGLKKYFLNKHLAHVDRFYRELERADYQSEATLKLRDRFKKNQDKLFTFLKFDGIPWHNNNAEHAIKAFARLRDVIEGTSTEKGTREYLTLLSVCQTCEYQGLDFLNFLRSGEKDINVFAESTRRRGRKISIGTHKSHPVPDSGSHHN